MLAPNSRSKNTHPASNSALRPIPAGILRLNSPAEGSKFVPAVVLPH